MQQYVNKFPQKFWKGVKPTSSFSSPPPLFQLLASAFMPESITFYSKYRFTNIILAEITRLVVHKF